ncbi:hypothetical protein OUZ56_013265 [Daphnia magna]|uniref:Uncharacterized protein n=1 Tax=Daphnia magna TaxID=35525 RepID=A0ABQ9Z5F6_9CRUS|nr:hypothetical protein OUZ56_013265 [Daphnia magna]
MDPKMPLSPGLLNSDENKLKHSSSFEFIQVLQEDPLNYCVGASKTENELVIAVATLISIATIALWYHTVFGIQNIEVQISLHPHLLFRMGSVDEDSNGMTKIVANTNANMDYGQHSTVCDELP